MAGIGDIRRASMGATRSVRAFQRAVAALKQRAVRAAQVAGREVFKRMGTRFATGFYADKAGRIVPITPYGAAWGKRKAKLGLDPRPGVARKGILKTVRSPLAFVRQPSGFSIDLARPNLTITGKATLRSALRNLAGKAIVEGKGKDRKVVGFAVNRRKTNKRSFAVNSYIGAFADSKAPGLGNIATRDHVYINGKVNDAIVDHIAKVKGAAKQVLHGKAKALIVLRLDRVAS